MKKAHFETILTIDKENRLYREHTEREIIIRTEALRKSEERFRELVDLLPEAICEMQIDGKITFVNQKAFDLFGYTQEDFDRGVYASDLIVPGERDHGLKHAKKIMRGEDVGLREYMVARKDGTTFPILFRANAIFQEEKIIGIRGIAIDISEKKGLEKRLQQAQKMEAIGTLAGGIAHDFNNILGGIIGYTELAQDSLPAEWPAHGDLLKVLGAGNRAKELVDQILAFNRQNKPGQKKLKIGVLIKEALKLLRASLPATIEIRKTMAVDSGLVKADPTQIHQVLTNLCTNAAHAMGEKGGVLDIRLAPVAVEVPGAGFPQDLNPGPYLKLTISDTGHGIGPDILDRIFDPYFTTKEMGEGTGLGLAVVHGIVKNHGGAITVESAPEKGTKFHVYLPRIEERDDPAERGHSVGGNPMGHEHVLIIDDEQDLADPVPVYTCQRRQWNLGETRWRTF